MQGEILRDRFQDSTISSMDIVHLQKVRSSALKG
jgi:hypothetical protein